MENINKLLEDSHSHIVQKVINYFELLGEDKTEDMDNLFWDENNIPRTITTDMLETIIDDMEDFDAYVGTTAL